MYTEVDRIFIRSEKNLYRTLLENLVDVNNPFGGYKVVDSVRNNTELRIRQGESSQLLRMILHIGVL